MIPRGHSGKVDANHAKIVEGLRALGCSVRSTAALSAGFPDIAVGYRGKNFFFEIKDQSKPPAKKRLTPAELAFIEAWRGQVAVVECLNDALTVMGITV